VLLNLSAITPLSSAVSLQGCGAAASTRAFTYHGGAQGFDTLAVSSADKTLKVSVAPYSITVLEVVTGAADR
jgi:hypothetical protein